MEKITLNQIQEFLKIKNIAMVGISRNPKDFSRVLANDLTKHGYNIIPINPNAEEIAGIKCYPNVSTAEKEIEGILVYTKKDAVSVIEEAITKGIKHIWLRNMFTPAREVEVLQKQCKEKNINFISGHCPYMFLEGSGFPHTFHRFILKMTGTFPKS